MTIAVILPTYNERDNIGALLARVFAQGTRIAHRLLVLVVDDDSPDGTADAVRALQPAHPDLYLLIGRKEGLGRAYVRGMTHALDVLGADAVVEMDADFSHDPDDLPRFVDVLDAGADFVIGSRYVPGGSIPSNWGRLRRANSAYGNVVARHIAGMRGVRDCTAGFRCIRASVLRAVRVETIRANGYCFQIELLHSALAAGARVEEIPVHFVDRTKGTSKLGLADVAEFLVSVWRLRLGSRAAFVVFCLVGVSGVAVNLGVFAGLLHVGVNGYLASPLAVLTSIGGNLLLTRAWRLRRQARGLTTGQPPGFTAVSLAVLPLSYGVFLMLTLATGAPSLLAQAAGVVPAMLVNYFLDVHRRSKP